MKVRWSNAVLIRSMKKPGYRETAGDLCNERVI